IVLLGQLAVAEDAYAEVAPPIAARVLALSADIGDRVAAETTLAELQSGELGRARSEYLAAAAAAEAARQTAERLGKLAAERIAPRRELETAIARRATADAELAAARSALEALGVSAEDAGKEVSR